MTSVLRFLGRQLFITPSIPQADLSSQVGIVTGSNVGLGLEAARHLLNLNIGQLILAVRSIEKGEAAKTELIKARPNATVHVWQLDYNSYDSVQAFVQKCAQLPRLDLAILNAAVIHPDLRLNPATGHEEGFQVNVLSTALLTLLLVPLLEKSSKTTGHTGKITIVGSEVSEWAPLAARKQDPLFAALDSPEFFGPMRYLDTKLLVNYFIRRVTSLVSADRVLINVANPGLCTTSLSRNADGFGAAAMNIQHMLLGRTAEVGARPLVKAAVDDSKASHGKYYSDNGYYPNMPGITPGAEADKFEDKLWREMMQELEFANVRSIVA